MTDCVPADAVRELRNRATAETYMRGDDLVSAEELLKDLDSLIAEARPHQDASVMQEDLKDLMAALGAPVHARPDSPHDIMREVIGTVARWREALEHFAKGCCRSTSDSIARTALARSVLSLRSDGPGDDF